MSFPVNALFVNLKLSFLFYEKLLLNSFFFLDSVIVLHLFYKVESFLVYIKCYIFC